MPSPDIRAVVVAAKPILARGLASVLSDTGIVVEKSEDLAGWATGPGTRVAIVATSIANWREVIRGLRDVRSDIAIVAVIDAESPNPYAESLEAGACSAVRSDASAGELAAVVDAAIRGFSLLPVRAAHRLVNSSDTASVPRVSPNDVELLRALAQGDYVAVLAERLGYSERDMHRKLRRLYDRIGAANRIRAIVLATRWGLITADEPHLVVDLTQRADRAGPTSGPHQYTPPRKSNGQ